ncbi:MAG: hypothetical protein JXA30_04110 [Deltaproteobacteria bacterium]|nr:hypothetical protein [Deltaproteobacteria bacterium]
MINATKWDDRIAIGGVPCNEDLRQLGQIGYKTVVDLREDREIFGAYVAKRATAVEMAYIHVPIRRSAVSTNDLVLFYETVFEKAKAPMYIFSRLGKKPLALLLLFNAVAKATDAERVFVEASYFGLDIANDICIRSLVIDLLEVGDQGVILPLVQKYRPDLLEGRIPKQKNKP